MKDSFGRRALFSFIAFTLGIMAAAAPAFAQDDVDPGEPESLGCAQAVGCEKSDVDFFWERQLFDDVDLDTGWLPANASVQVRFGLKVLARSQVGLGGTVETSWPRPLDVAIPGRPDEGLLSVGYGLEVFAKMKIDVTVLGKRYQWEGDIPFLSKIPMDLLLAADTVFDPFALGPDVPAVFAEDTTDRIRVFTYDLTSLAGVDIPGLEGSISLDLQAHLGASYKTEQLEIHPVLPLPAGAVPITIEGESSILMSPGPQGFGAGVDFDVLPIGHLEHVGTIELFPHVTVKILGINVFDKDIFALPLQMPASMESPPFEPAPVHVPLPDVVVEGEGVGVGPGHEVSLPFVNQGEAPLQVSVLNWPAAFGTAPTALVIAGAESGTLTFTVDAEAGNQDLVLSFLTNDPDAPLVTRRVLVQAGLGPMGPLDGDGAGDADGCGCRVAARADDTRGLAGAGMLAFLGLVVAVGRRRRR